MVDDKTPPAVPTWQKRAGLEESIQNAKEQTQDVEEPAVAQQTSNEMKEITPSSSTDPESSASEASITATPEAISSEQLEQVTKFLQDPTVKNAPVEKRRAFLESKGVSSDLIDQALTTTSAQPPRASDFAVFQKSQGSSPPPAEIQRVAAPPPIITYPEFLMEAHKPPPLVTASRLLNATYILGGVSTLIYAASRHLVAPMSAELDDARHDFASHTRAKLEEMNERLSGLASKAPDTKRTASNYETASVDEDESVDSDPTELYHRDVGVQTSPPPSPRLGHGTSDDCDSSDDDATADATTAQYDRLRSLHDHLETLLTGSQAMEEINKTRREDATALRQYLDRLAYTSPFGAPMWRGDVGDDKKADDGLKQLKAEITRIKGVLLNPAQFPGAGGRGAARQTPRATAHGGT